MAGKRTVLTTSTPKREATSSSPSSAIPLDPSMYWRYRQYGVTGSNAYLFSVAFGDGEACAAAGAEPKAQSR